MGRIHRKVTETQVWHTKNEDYDRFDDINGFHSWQKSMPEGCVLYPVRKLNTGKIIYFNFELAKEMGLLPKNHPNEINKKLEKKLIDTFSIRIINEYDQCQNIKYHPSVTKNNLYMATRYLQLQHKNKRGRTSGDGRSIWNGEITHSGITWDISSRGTGVTKLAPGSVEADKPLKTGAGTFGYGCGLADIDELISCAIQSEIFHNNGIQTERVLCIIDSEDGNGIGVRAGKNLFRPAHLFMYLKQERHSELKKATDYLIDRQNKNKEWSFNINSKNKYDLMLDELTSSFAKFSAQLDRDYIFAWLDWDGDNVLFNAGIIDYGSIRQFGLRHDEYRYDDVDRFSTNLNEQRQKAKELIQIFAQMVDYIKTGNRKPIKKFANTITVKSFDGLFKKNLYEQFLIQIGFDRKTIDKLISKKINLVKNIYESFSILERIKTKKKTRKVSDGINRPAILNMRTLLYELPSYLIREAGGELTKLPPSIELFRASLAHSARGVDRKITPAVIKKFKKFKKDYLRLMSEALPNSNRLNALNKIYNNAFEVNRPDRLTGDGLLYVVDELLNFLKKNHSRKSIQTAIDQLIIEQSLKKNNTVASLPPTIKPLFITLLSLVDGNKESI